MVSLETIAKAAGTAPSADTRRHILSTVRAQSLPSRMVEFTEQADGPPIETIWLRNPFVAANASSAANS